MRILVVDDEADMRLLVRIMLESEGHEVVERGDSIGALEAVEQESLDLVLLDIRIPPFDGLEVLKRIRSDPANDALPTIMFSAHSSEGTLKRARRLGSNGYLIKPFTREELLAAVDGIPGGD
ncbi:MAG: response regulator [Actinomycetota bacterium]